MSDQGVAEVSESGAVERKPVRRKRRVWVWVVGGLLAVMVLLALFVSLLPTMLSSSMVRGAVVDAVNDGIPGRMTVQSWSMGWWTAPRMEGFELVDERGQRVLTLDRFEAVDVTLASLLMGGLDFGVVEVVSPVAEIERFADGSTNLERALGVSSSGSSGGAGGSGSGSGGSMVGLPYGLRAEVKVTGAELRVVDPVVGEVATSFEATFEARTLDDLSVSAEAAVEHGGHEGKLVTSWRARDWASADGRLTAETGQIEGETRLTELPMALVDALLGRALGTELVGETLDVEVLAGGGLEALQLVARGESERLVFEVSAEREGEAVVVRSGPLVNWELRPEGLALLQTGTDAAVVIDRSVRVVVELNEARWDPASGGRAGMKLGLQPVVAMVEMAMDPSRGSAARALVVTHASLAEPLSMEGLVVNVEALGTSAEDLMVRVDVPAPVMRLGGRLLPLGASALVARLSGQTLVLEDATGIGFTSGGRVGLSGTIGVMDALMPADLDVVVEALSLRPLLVAYLGPENFVSNTAGVLDAAVSFEGPLSEAMTQAGGGGTVRVRDGNLAPLPVLSDVLGFALESPLDLNAITGGNKLQDAADVAFTLEGNRVRLGDVQIDASLAVVNGRGTVGFDQTLDTVVSVKLKAQDELGQKVDDEIGRVVDRVGGELGGLLGDLGRRVRREVQEEVTDRLLTFEVKGSVEAPVIGRSR
ncbi:MAG: hypothetical protein RLN76_11770 [Phycisphaeraceae bacterium]